MKGLGGKRIREERIWVREFFFSILINRSFKQKANVMNKKHDLSSLFLDESACIHDMA